MYRSIRQRFAHQSCEVLVLYLERPQRNSGQVQALRGALLIQRLEGSRPHGSLCTLNRAGRAQRDQEQTELHRMRLPEERMKQRNGSPRPDVEAQKGGIRGILAG